MKRTIRYYRIMWLRYDLAAGLTVFLVALPLCLGIALASGAPLYSGLLSGVIGGLLVSVISGSQLAVSGPAAGLTTVVAASIVSLGDFRVFLLAVIVAGLFQVLLGILKLGTISNYFPSAVIKGMLAAIGVMLISKQIPIALGYDQPNFWTSGFLELFDLRNFEQNAHYFSDHISVGVIIISVLSLATLSLFNIQAIRKRFIVPSPLLVVVIGIVINLLVFVPSSGLVLKPTQLVRIPENVLANISFPDFSKLFSNTGILKDGIVIGLLASLETLLCIEATDKLDRRNRITPINRELVAQGIGNITCGMLGAIPITAVVVRGSANVDAGARTRLSAFTHGAYLLLAILLIPFVLNQIPYASLSAILILTGYNLAKPKLFINMWSLGLRQFIPFIVTIVGILVTDLLVGVSIGLLFSFYYIVQNNFKAEYRISETVDDGTDTYLIKLNTNVTFLNKVNLRKSLDRIPPDSRLTIDGTHCNFIDYDILEIISEYHGKAADRRIELTVKGVQRVNVTAVH
ncbi:MAG: SulP family inorganic anion transporter [Chlorobi bacterium]|nr:MAG: SulP family inorganic anion transporter [Bacteroidota bacterium]MBE2266527.1 SulP family inorganic anion transporter [Flavobacteriales bacterium]MBL1161900.1 SulP family inorganic anion transporter [Chlorobiota bacterium]MBW7852679.1 SulP family inorganic anion transporter [Candidatus Kapabacteria bacterium]MCC6331061.1 SulP family inorganic anion transporter [Ignavibacteria bacterium]